MKRAQMMSKVQELYKEISVLQAELKLLLIKKVPILHNMPKNSKLKK